MHETFLDRRVQLRHSKFTVVVAPPPALPRAATPETARRPPPSVSPRDGRPVRSEEGEHGAEQTGVPAEAEECGDEELVKHPVPFAPLLPDAFNHLRGETHMRHERLRVAP